MGWTILVVDDSALVRRQVAAALTAADFTVVEAVDGADALSRLGEHPAVRLVVCDFMMPNMNGLEFLARYRALGASAPVLMLTTEIDPALIAEAKALGAAAWMNKPASPAALVAAAQRLIGRA